MNCSFKKWDIIGKMSFKIQFFSNRIADFLNLWPLATGFTFGQTFGLRRHIPLAAVAVAKGEKPSATAIDLRPSVDHCPGDSGPPYFSFP